LDAVIGETERNGGASEVLAPPSCCSLVVVPSLWFADEHQEPRV